MKTYTNRAVYVKLYPNHEQAKMFNQMAGCSRFIYNWGLNRWNELYNLNMKVGAITLMYELAELKKQKEFQWLNDAHAQALQCSLIDLGQAFQCFFKGKNDYPVFKKKGKRDSFRVPQAFKILPETSELKLPKIGVVRCKGLRVMDGIPKSITIVKKGDNWYASILYQVLYKEVKHPNNTIIGIDVGIKHLVTTYDGEKTAFHDHNPKLKELYNRLTILQKQASHKTKGSNNQKKVYKKIAKLHQRITNMRKDTLHKVSRDICKNHAFVCVEDLKILNMSKSASGTIDNPGKRVAQKRGLNRSITRQGWGIFFQMLVYKTQETGSKICVFDARFTSQTCPECLHQAKENRPTQSLFKCVECGFTHNADAVAAINLRGKLTPDMLMI